MPWDEAARRVGAVVVTASPVGQDYLSEQTRSRLSGFKVPTRWLLVDDPERVPRLASGKADVGAPRRLPRRESVTSPRRTRSL